MLLLIGCLDNDPIPGGAGDSFVAMQSDFADFQSWMATPVAEGDTGHPDGDRVVYLNAEPETGASAFPVGTMIVKTIAWSGGTDIHAMVKRGGGFNPDGAVGWEWFEIVLSDQGSPVILWRGDVPPEGEVYGQLPGQTADTSTTEGDCNACHGAAVNNDYVHTLAL